MKSYQTNQYTNRILTYRQRNRKTPPPQKKNKKDNTTIVNGLRMVSRNDNHPNGTLNTINRPMISIQGQWCKSNFTYSKEIKQSSYCMRPKTHIWHAKVTKSRETRFHSRKLGFAPYKLGLSRVNPGSHSIN